MSDEKAEMSGASVLFSLDDLVAQSHRIATKDNLSEVRQLLVALAQGMPPQTSLRQAVCFLMIAQASSTGRRTTVSDMKSQAEGEAFFDLLGTTTSRTVKSLADAGLIKTVPSEYDRRALEIMMLPEGYALIDLAMDQIKEPHERKA